VDRIVLTPEKQNGHKRLSIDLIGALAGILSLSAGNKKAALTPDGLHQLKLVAGVGFEHTTSRL
jgi:hypothetical protein